MAEARPPLHIGRAAPDEEAVPLNALKGIAPPQLGASRVGDISMAVHNKGPSSPLTKKHGDDIRPVLVAVVGMKAGKGP